MKKLIFFICVLLFNINTMLAQDQKEIARFYVTHANYNGNDVTEWAVSRKVFTVFYTINDELYMANVSDVDDDQSWGKVWGFRNETREETSTDYKLIYSISIGIILIVMILRKEPVKYNFSRFISHKALSQN